MKTPKLTRYRLRWLEEEKARLWVLLFGQHGRMARVRRDSDGKCTAVLWPNELAVADGYQVAYTGQSLTQAKRSASAAIRLFMCREVDEATVLGKRVKRGRVRR